MPPPALSPSFRRRVVAVLVALGLALGLVLLPSVSDATGRRGPKPTIVLVHGAFADASGWNGVTTRLQRRGTPSSPRPTRSGA